MKEIIKSSKRKLDDSSTNDDSTVVETVEKLFSNSKVGEIAQGVNNVHIEQITGGNGSDLALISFIIFEDILQDKRVIFESNGENGFGVSIEPRTDIRESKPEKTSLTVDEAGEVLRIFSSIEQIINSILLVKMGAFSAKVSIPQLSIDICERLSFEQKIRYLIRFSIISKEQLKVLDKIRKFRNNVAHSPNTLQVMYNNSFYNIIHTFTVDTSSIKEALLNIYDNDQAIVIDYLHGCLEDG